MKFKILLCLVVSEPFGLPIDLVHFEIHWLHFISHVIAVIFCFMFFTQLVGSSLKRDHM